MTARHALAALAAACLCTHATAQAGPGMGIGPGAGPAAKPAQVPGAMQVPGRAVREGSGLEGGPMLPGVETLDLTPEQREKVTGIRRELQRRVQVLTVSLRELRLQTGDADRVGEFDAATARKRYDEAAAIRKQMFEARLEARVELEAVLTKEQREQLRKAARPTPPGPAPRR